MNVRHFVHRLSSRVRYGKNLLAFVAAQTTRLTVAAGKATAVLTGTGTTNAADTQVIVIGAKTYTLQGTLTNVDGHVKIGASLTATLLNVLHAVNASGGTPGTDYAAAMVAHADVDALASDATTVSLRAKVAGTAGNSIVSTTTFASASFAAGTFAGGTATATPDIYDYLKRNTSDQIAAAANVGALH